MNVSFFFEVLLGGLLAGVMYSLVAIGFVLIYKASGVFNFAQGAMVFMAALTFVSLLERGVPFARAGADGPTGLFIEVNRRADRLSVLREIRPRSGQLQRAPARLVERLYCQF